MVDTSTYLPTWPGSSFEIWSKRFVRGNQWRVAHTYDYDEALQECAVVFTRCLNRYVLYPKGERRVFKPAHFMALFKTCVERQFHIYAVRDGRARNALEQGGEDMHPVQNDDEAESQFQRLLAEGSTELCAVITTIASAPAEFLALMLKETKRPQVWSRRIARLSGISQPSGYVLEELRDRLDGSIVGRRVAVRCVESGRVRPTNASLWVGV